MNVKFLTTVIGCKQLNARLADRCHLICAMCVAYLADVLPGYTVVYLGNILPGYGVVYLGDVLPGYTVVYLGDMLPGYGVAYLGDDVPVKLPSCGG